MGEYAPDDQRAVHNADAKDWRAQEEAQQDKNANDRSDDAPPAQMGYGNARNDDGMMEQDVPDAKLNNSLDAPNINSAQPGEVSSRPDVRARADAGRPIDGGQ